MIKNNFIRLLPMCLCILSCHAQTNRQDVKSSNIDTVKLDVKDYNISPERKQLFKRIDDSLHLLDLSKGVNGEVIRASRSYINVDSARFLILTRKDAVWEATYLTYIILPIGNSASEFTVSKVYKSVLPKSGWSVIEDSLLKFGVRDWKDYRDFPEYRSVSDGDELAIEYADCKLYRKYILPDPLFNTGNNQGAKVYAFLKFMKSEFDLNGFLKK